MVVGNIWFVIHSSECGVCVRVHVCVREWMGLVCVCVSVCASSMSISGAEPLPERHCCASASIRLRRCLNMYYSGSVCGGVLLDTSNSGSPSLEYLLTQT